MGPAENPPSTTHSSFRPTAALETLRVRGELLALTRQFFRAQGFWEVETPILSRDIVVDAYLEPFVTHARNVGGAPPADELFLQTSPEFAMKRLLASGATALFQVTRAFRRGEIGALHNPEFTIVEWYRTGSTYHEQMNLVEQLVIEFFRFASDSGGTVLNRAGGRPVKMPAQFERMTYDAAFESVLGRPVIGRSAVQLRDLAQERNIDAPAPPGLHADDVDGWLNLLLALVVEPELARRPAVFVYDYPPGQAALARIRGNVAERFELYVGGIEICNGYQELTDPAELRRRIAAQSALRRREGNRALPQGSRLLDAMEAGLPPCAGVALGFDRLLMAALGAQSLAEVMAFPFDVA